MSFDMVTLSYCNIKYNINYSGQYNNHMILRMITIINFSAVYFLKNFHRIRLSDHFTKNMMCLNKIMLSHKSYVIVEYFLDFLSQMSHSGDLLYLVFIRRRESSDVCL